jgi:hypothetical protein
MKLVGSEACNIFGIICWIFLASWCIRTVHENLTGLHVQKDSTWESHWVTCTNSIHITRGPTLRMTGAGIYVLMNGAPVRYPVKANATRPTWWDSFQNGLFSVRSAYRPALHLSLEDSGICATSSWANGSRKLWGTYGQAPYREKFRFLHGD